jgi:putative phosphoribosyl transferase
MLAAVRALRQEDAGRVVVAVPVAARRTCSALGEHVDEIICARTPPDFVAVGEWYIDFSQTTDAEVRDLLARAELERSPLQGAGR